MDTPESIAAALWNERGNFPTLRDDEFQSQDMLLQYLKQEMNGMKSFCDLDTARRWLASLDESANKT